MEIVERAIGDLTILDLKGRLVAGDGDEVFRDIVGRLVDGGQRKVLLNLADVTAVDSCGVGVLVSKYITLCNRGGQLKLYNLRPRSFRVLDITKLLTVMESFESEADAVRSFANT